MRTLVQTLPAGTIITFDPALNGDTITLVASISTSNAMTIQGPGASLMTIDGAGTTSLFQISNATTISGLSLNDGYSSSGGGAMSVYAPLTLDGCSFNNNRTDSYGGAISSYADTVTITNSSFSNNSATYHGGAIIISTFSGSPVFTLTNSLFYANSSTSGPGSAVSLYAGTGTITNSTFVDNDGPQGAITNYSTGALALAFVTVTGTTNSPAFVNQSGGEFSLKNSIVVGNPAGDFDDYGQWDSGDYNVLASAPIAEVNLQSHDIVDGSITLNALADNGGATKTIKLSPLSIEENAIPPAQCTDLNGDPLLTDQRNQPRPAGSGCDIGAYEMQAADFVAGICGDGHLDQGEQCDDGNAVQTDGCLNNCVAPTCGDGFTEAGVEVCDGGPADLGCSADCQTLEPMQIAVSKQLIGAYGIAFDGVNLWVTDGQSGITEVSRVTDKAIQSFSEGDQPFASIFAAGSLWVANRFDDSVNSTGGGLVNQIDPSTGSTIASIPVDALPYAMATDGTHVWSAGSGDNKICEINAVTATLVGCPAVGPATHYFGLAFDGTDLWAADATGSVFRIDPSNNAILGEFDAHDFVSGLAWDGHAMWVTLDSAGTAVKVDPTSMTVVATVAVGAGPGAATFDGSNVWIANSGANTVTRIDPNSNTATYTVTVGTGPIGMVFDGTDLWVVNINDATVSEVRP